MSPDSAPLSPPPAVALRARHDGWTPDRQQRFLAALAGSCSVAAAAAVVGMTAQSAYALCRRADAAAFRAAWDAARVKPVTAPGPSRLDALLADETVVRLRAGLGKNRGTAAGNGPFTINRPIRARALIRLLDRAAAKAAKVDNRSIS